MENLENMDPKDEKNICEFCLKEFCSKATLLRHQKTTKSCLELQGKKDANIECLNCKKTFAIQYYKQHQIKCDVIFEKTKTEQKEELEKISKQNEKIKSELLSTKKHFDKIKDELLYSKSEIVKLNHENTEYKNIITNLEKEVQTLKSIVTFLEKQNDKFHASSTNITMKLAEKVNTVNNNTVVINTNQLTNDVLRQCATTFSIDNAYNINGITKHLTNSLEDHIICTDPSRNIFKYTNEKDEEIVDHNLEILLPQYLTAVKDRNNFLYKEVFEYFEKNNVSLDIKTDYQVFYNALNSIIEKNGQQNKYTEKCKREMVKECKRRFLEKNKNKEKSITKELSINEVMMNIIETGGTLNDFVNRYFRYNIDEEETDEQFSYRRQMEDLFREKKKEWRTRNQKD